MRRRAAETGAPARGDVNLMRILPFVVLPLLGLSLTVWGCETRASQQARPPDALSLDVVAEAPDAVRFGGPEQTGLVQYDPLQEASGLVASRVHPGVLWTHNDSGDGPYLYALTTDGRHLGVFTLSGAEARDWEDLAIGPGPIPGVDYLYAGDIGDNDAQQDLKYVYRVAEPAVGIDQAPGDASLTDVAKITLRYPDGPSDAETMLVDPLSGDLYVLTKRSTDVAIYRAAAPVSTSDVITMERSGTVALPRVAGAPAAGQGAVGGDISPSGLEVLLKTYSSVYYWRRDSADDAFFGVPHQTLPYVPEPQGEAIAWAADQSGYFTLSEEPRSIPAMLYFYPRQQAP